VLTCSGRFPAFEKLRLARTARVQLESRAIWDWLPHAEGIARDVRNVTVADWDEAHLRVSVMAYDGAPIAMRLANQNAEANGQPTSANGTWPTSQVRRVMSDIVGRIQPISATPSNLTR
jgi:hypothetical protein